MNLFIENLTFSFFSCDSLVAKLKFLTGGQDLRTLVPKARFIWSEYRLVHRVVKYLSGAMLE